MRHLLVALSLAALLGCANGLAPANDVSGTWDANYTIPGAGLSLTLAQTNASISGSGSYRIEAGRSGTLQVAGSYQRPNISLVLHYDYGPVYTYSGIVQGDREMSGTLGASSLSFTRR